LNLHTFFSIVALIYFQRDKLFKEQFGGICFQLGNIINLL